MIPVTWPEINNIHPFVPLDQVSNHAKPPSNTCHELFILHSPCLCCVSETHQASIYVALAFRSTCPEITAVTSDIPEVLLLLKVLRCGRVCVRKSSLACDTSMHSYKIYMHICQCRYIVHFPGKSTRNRGTYIYHTKFVYGCHPQVTVIRNYTG
jgi:hypothetical protein